MKNNDVRDDAQIVRENYNNNAQAEWERLDGFHFEFEIAKHYLNKYLRGKTVLDIGGGPGRYSVYLAQQGYDVTLVDLSEGNIELAKQKFLEYGLDVKAYVCDARDLFSLQLEKFDNVLLMGPLYHLSNIEDRKNVFRKLKTSCIGRGVNCIIHYVDGRAKLLLRCLS